jgi:hypothetical protein
MSRAHRSLLLLPASYLFLMLLSSRVASSTAPADWEREDAPPSFAKLQRGMTPEQVRRIVGSPKYIARQILYHRYREQWLYDTPTPVRLTFDCPRGQKPQLLFLSGLPDEIGH